MRTHPIRSVTGGCLLATLLAAPLPLLAQDDYDYIWARVVSVDPIVVRSERPETREVCWEQPVTYYQPGRSYPTYRRDPTTGTLIGALVGGALGNQVGSGTGRTAATIAGAVGGGAIGRRIAADPESEREVADARPQYEEVCEVRSDREPDRRVIGYDVAYELEGEVFHARTDAHPGDQIRVAVMPFEEQ